MTTMAQRPKIRELIRQGLTMHYDVRRKWPEPDVGVALINFAYRHETFCGTIVPRVVKS
jgi:hypothetical protein